MAAHCQIPNAIERLLSASYVNVAFVGGSLTVGVGASNSAETSWRALFVKYLYQNYHTKYQSQVSEVMGAVGAAESYVTVFTLGRNVLPNNPGLTFIEFCVNDQGAPDKQLVTKGMEGMVRQLLSLQNPSQIIIVGAGARSGDIDHSIHRKVADHYDVPFVDVQSYIFAKLQERGQTWDDVALEFEEKDPCHLNDLGQRLWFEALRDCFEEHVALYHAGKRKERRPPLPAPIVSDEFQFVRLIDPAVKSKAVVLEGEWQRKPDGFFPWYFDSLLAGQPGARMTLKFKGTAVAVFGLMHHNGLKAEAELDGKEIPGAYLRHVIEFGKGIVLAHGLPDGEHVLKLTVAEASKRHNKHENPTTRIAYFGVAGKTDSPGDGLARGR
jgi:lysophospholipase L1-like esterase